MSQFFASGCQSIEASASASVLPKGRRGEEEKDCEFRVKKMQTIKYRMDK